MTASLQTEDVISIITLGKFSIQKQEFVLNQAGTRAKQVWLLIEYLIAHRRAETPVEKLIEVLWSDDESITDPLNALKNLVYRARDLLKNGLHDSSSQFILYSNGTYRWNPALACVVDSEELERLAKEAASCTGCCERQAAYYEKAVSHYQGDFLPNSSDSPWVVTRAVYLSNLYVNCVLKLCSLYEETQRYHEIIAVCEAAILRVPFEEALHKVLSYAYISTGQNNKALQHYNYVTDLFLRELGVDISGSLREIYRKIQKSINQAELDLSVIKGDLKEVLTDHTAFFCDYEIFKNLYRMQARLLMRTGQSVFVVLLSLLDSQGGIPEDFKKAVPVANLLKDVIVHSLRKGDTVAAFSPTQFIVMLPLTSYENAEIVIQRLIKSFKRSYPQKEFKIMYKFSPVESVDI